jgi:photosystem II stability/assembly factor-like uncharacterized protein
LNPANRNQGLALLDKLYRTTDGGASWTAVNTTKTLPIVGNGEVPRSFGWSRDGAKIWAGSSNGSIYRSVDGGLTWTKQMGESPAGSAITQIEVDASNDDRAYALSSSGLYTTSNGTDWTLQNSTGLSWIAASPAESGVLLAILASDGTIVRSANSGAGFTAHSAEKPLSLYFAPSQAGTVYARYATAEVAASNDGGATWSRYSLFRQGCFDAGISPTDPDHVMLATTAGAIVSSNGLKSGTMGTRGLSELYFDKLIPRFVAGDEKLYASTPQGNENAYVRASTGTWFGRGGSTTNLLGDAITFISFHVAPSDGTMYLARAGNFGASTPDDANWVRRGANDGAYRLAIDPTNSQVIYSTDGFFNARLSVDGGANWTSFADDLPEDIGDFAVNDKHPARVYALKHELSGFPQNPLYVSENGGTTWTMAGWPGGFGLFGNVLAHEPGSENTVYVGLESGLFKTTDGGATWTQLNPYPATLTPDAITSIAIDPAAPQTVYVSTRYDYPPMRSVDGGANWEPLHSAAADDEGLVEGVVVDPTRPSALAGRVTYGGLVELTLAPDLALTSVGSLTAGTAGSTTLTITNRGKYTATALHLAATLPAATGSYSVNATGLTCATTGTALTCDAPLLRPDATATVTLGLTPTASGSWQASIAAREADSVSNNNSLSLTVAAASSGGSGGGASGGKGGGGGGFDYLLLLALVIVSAMRLHRAARRQADGAERATMLYRSYGGTPGLPVLEGFLDCTSAQP